MSHILGNNCARHHVGEVVPYPSAAKEALATAHVPFSGCRHDKYVYDLCGIVEAKTIFPTLNSQNYIEFQDNIKVMATF